MQKFVVVKNAAKPMTTTTTSSQRQEAASTGAGGVATNQLQIKMCGYLKKKRKVSAQNINN